MRLFIEIRVTGVTYVKGDCSSSLRVYMLRVLPYNYIAQHNTSHYTT